VALRPVAILRKGLTRTSPGIPSGAAIIRHIGSPILSLQEDMRRSHEEVASDILLITPIAFDHYRPLLIAGISCQNCLAVKVWALIGFLWI